MPRIEKPHVAETEKPLRKPGAWIDLAEATIK
jgi:hypothetical protein